MSLLQLRSYIEGLNRLGASLRERQNRIGVTNAWKFQGKSQYQSQPQEKAKPARAGAKLDDSLLTGKKPSSDLDKAQRIATSGETVPIVFGKRTSDIGGIWVQPSMLKTGTNNFVGSFLYAISQGEIVSSPVKHRTWVGLRNVAFLPDQTITLGHDYATAVTLAAAPSVCPIGGSSLFCGVETYSYLSELYKAEVNATFTEIVPADFYVVIKEITRGSGDTSNSTFQVATNSFQVFNSDTGADVTAAFLTYAGISPSPSVFFPYNAVFSGSTIVGGKTVGTIESLGTISPSSAFNSALGLPPGSNAVFVYTVTAVNNQVNISNPPSSGTLAGVQREFIVSPYANPSNTPTADNSAYADITFLRVNGNIYDPPDQGSFPTTTKQLFIFYEQGVEVNLYSGGLISGSYATGASNQLVDLVMYLFTIYKRAAGAATAEIAAPIFTGNLTDIAAFCDEYDLHFNGIVEESVNLLEFASAVAPYFLLSFLSVGGQYRFEPILPLNGSNQLDLTALTPAATFTEDSILPGSFSKSYKAVAERRPIIAVLLWRESNPSEVGIQRTVQVAFSSTSLDAPVEQFDLTDFCCDPAHAAIYGKYELARRQYSTHGITFQTPLVTTGLIPTSIIKVEKDRITSKGDNRTETDWYQITNITHSSDGISTIEAEHFPVGSGDVSVISDAIINGSFRVLS
jgi:hypothetical protein